MGTVLDGWRDGWRCKQICEECVLQSCSWFIQLQQKQCSSFIHRYKNHQCLHWSLATEKIPCSHQNLVFLFAWVVGIITVLNIETCVGGF